MSEGGGEGQGGRIGLERSGAALVDGEKKRLGKRVSGRERKEAVFRWKKSGASRLTSRSYTFLRRLCAAKMPCLRGWKEAELLAQQGRQGKSAREKEKHCSRFRPLLPVNPPPIPHLQHERLPHRLDHCFNPLQLIRRLALPPANLLDGGQNA